MRLTLEIEMDNASFAFNAHGAGCEVGHILSNLGAALSARGLIPKDEGLLRDHQGNRVGFWQVED